MRLFGQFVYPVLDMARTVSHLHRELKEHILEAARAWTAGVEQHVPTWTGALRYSMSSGVVQPLGGKAWKWSPPDPAALAKHVGKYTGLGMEPKKATGNAYLYIRNKIDLLQGASEVDIKIASMPILNITVSSDVPYYPTEEYGQSGHWSPDAPWYSFWWGSVEWMNYVKNIRVSPPRLKKITIRI